MNALPPGTTRPTILVFGRNYLIGTFRANARALESEFDFQFLTDGVCPGTADTRADFYAALDGNRRSSELSENEEADVILRCRMLRNIDPATSSRLVHAMAVALDAAFERIRPACVLSQMVDEYVTHLVALLAAKRGIGYVGFCAGYFPGRSLLLADAHGRPFNWREADDVEVAETLAQISPREFRQNYNLKADYGWLRHLRSLARYQVKRVVFATRRRVQRDYWNIHYAMTPFLAERRRLQDYPYASHFHTDWRAELGRLRDEKPGAPIVYFPLGYFPEATVDYWIRNKRAIRYEEFVLEVVATLARDSIVVVKEHLHMMGARNGAFLAALKAIPGIVNVHPSHLSNEVVDASNAVLLGAGSPGIEATVRGKPVFSFCDTSYWFEPAKAVFMDIDAIDAWSIRIRDRLASFQPPSRDDLHRAVRGFLRSSTRIEPESKIWPLLRKDDFSQVLRLAIARAGERAAASLADL